MNARLSGGGHGERHVNMMITQLYVMIAGLNTEIGHLYTMITTARQDWTVTIAQADDVGIFCNY
jgi:hypothetical protein